MNNKSEQQQNQPPLYEQSPPVQQMTCYQAQQGRGLMLGFPRSLPCIHRKIKRKR